MMGSMYMYSGKYTFTVDGITSAMPAFAYFYTERDTLEIVANLV